MKRIIVIWMMLILLLGCATTKAIDKTGKAEPVKTEQTTIEEKKEENKKPFTNWFVELSNWLNAILGAGEVWH